jgi:hypothetical protein
VRAFKLLARPYEELAQSLKVPDAIHNCLQTHNSVFTEDKNLGLISQAVKQQEMTRIAALGETYLAISVEDVARKLYGSKSVEELAEDLPRLEYLVLQMVHPTKLYIISTNSRLTKGISMQPYPAPLQSSISSIVWIYRVVKN